MLHFPTFEKMISLISKSRSEHKSIFIINEFEQIPKPERTNISLTHLCITEGQPPFIHFSVKRVLNLFFFTRLDCSFKKVACVGTLWAR